MDSIFHRISVRKYEKKPVEPEKILQILRAGMAAPSARNQQPWEFYVVTDPGTINELAYASPYGHFAEHAPVIIVCASRKNNCPSEEFIPIDMSICQENMWLETDSLGLGGTWIGIAPVEERMQAVEEILKIPDNLRAFSIFALGYPAEERPQQDRFDDTRIHCVGDGFSLAGEGKKYGFYGWDTGELVPVAPEYQTIRSAVRLYELLSEVWCAVTCSPRMRDSWTPENKTLGQCSITAFLVQDIFGGDVYGMSLAGGLTHCYNVIDGKVIDLTCEQFGEKAKNLVYENNKIQSREEHFAREEKSRRYEILKSSLLEKLSSHIE